MLSSTAQRIYETIKELEFFKNLFASYHPDSNLEILLDLCSTLKYEVSQASSFVFQQGDVSNNKFYVILSGQVGVISAKNRKPGVGRQNVHFQPTTQSLNDLPASSIERQPSESKKEEENPRQSVGKKGGLRFGENFGTAVAMTMAVKKVAQKARFLLRTKNNVQSLNTMENEGNNAIQDFKELAESYGQLIRTLSAGSDFGDAGNCR